MHMVRSSIAVAAGISPAVLGLAGTIAINSNNSGERFGVGFKAGGECSGRQHEAPPSVRDALGASRS